MANGKFVAYLRVSTARQGRSGLGIEAQRTTVAQFVSSRSGRLLDPEYVEVETGKMNARPELAKALSRCRATGAALVVAKLDRLSRNAAFLMMLKDSGVDFVAADLPEVNTMTLGVMALVAQHEAEMISSRTKAALAAAKARGTKLGGRRVGSGDIGQHQQRGVVAASKRAAERLADVAGDLRSLSGRGLSLTAMAKRLNDGDVRSTGGGFWTATSVRRAMARL